MYKQYTSNFANKDVKTGNIPNGYKLLSISVGTPPFYEGESLDCAKPRWSLVHSYKNGFIDEQEYEVLYFTDFQNRAVLIEEHINEIRNGGKFIYLCYCKKDGFCHRHLWAKFLNKLGIECEEL